MAVIPPERRDFTQMLFQEFQRNSGEYLLLRVERDAAERLLLDARRRLRELVDQLDEEAGIKRCRPRRKEKLHPETKAAIAEAAS